MGDAPLRATRLKFSSALGKTKGNMKKTFFYIKTIAWILLTTFLVQDISWALGGSSAVWTTYKDAPKGIYSDSKSLKLVSIPKTLGISQEAHFTNSDQTVIQIQDAHDSIEAQNRIFDILNVLASDYNVKSVALEGSSGAIDPSLFKSYPNQVVAKKAAEDLVKQGRLNAGELFSILSNEPVSIYGVEKRSLYRQNLKAFKDLLREKEKITNDLKGLTRTLEVLSERIDGPIVREIHKNGALSREGELQFTKKWDYLKTLAASKSIQYEKYPNLKILSGISELEKEIDFNKANAERDSLLVNLKSKVLQNDEEKLVLKSLAFKAGKLSESEFYLFLSDLASRYALDPAEYPNLSRFTRYILTFETIDLSQIFDELESYEKEILNAYFTSEDEKTLDRLKHRSDILIAFLSGTATSKEFEYYLNHKSDFFDKNFGEVITKLSEKYHVPLYNGLNYRNLERVIPYSQKFYSLAEKRNSVLIQNTLKKMQKENRQVAALVTGGFHTKGISNILRNDELSYLVVLPRVTDPNKKRPYLTIITRKKEAYEKALSSESSRYKIAMGTLLDMGRANGYLTEADILKVLFTFIEDLKKSDNSEALLTQWMSAYTKNYKGKQDKNYSLHPERLEQIIKLQTRDQTLQTRGKSLQSQDGARLVKDKSVQTQENPFGFITNVMRGFEQDASNPQNRELVRVLDQEKKRFEELKALGRNPEKMKFLILGAGAGMIVYDLQREYGDIFDFEAINKEPILVPKAEFIHYVIENRFSSRATYHYRHQKAKTIAEERDAVGQFYDEFKANVHYEDIEVGFGFEEASFDYVLLTPNVMTYLQDKLGVIRGIKKLLKKDGTAYISDARGFEFEDGQLINEFFGSLDRTDQYEYKTYSNANIFPIPSILKIENLDPAIDVPNLEIRSSESGRTRMGKIFLPPSYRTIYKTADRRLQTTDESLRSQNGARLAQSPIEYTLVGGDLPGSGNAILLNLPNNKALLLDAGIDYERLAELKKALGSRKLEAIILSHAHLDHTRATPFVHREFPDVPIYATSTTARILRVLWEDQQFLKNNISRNLVGQTQRSIARLQVNEWYAIGSESKIYLSNAGHVPGAVSVYVATKNGDILYSGDASFMGQKGVVSNDILPLNKKPDVLIVESTNGGRNFDPIEQRHEEMIREVQETIQARGKILIPSFAVGRATEVALILEKAMQEGQIPPTPIYFGGMAAGIVHQLQLDPDYPQFKDWFKPGSLIQEMRGNQAIQEVIQSDRPVIVIAGSGMLQGGVALRFFRNWVENENNKIIFVGYLANDSFGTQVLRTFNKNKHKKYARHFIKIPYEGKRKVTDLAHADQIELVPLNMQVKRIPLSAHATHDELILFIGAVQAKQTFLVHGDETAKTSLIEDKRLKNQSIETFNLGTSLSLAEDRSSEFDGIRAKNSPLSSEQARPQVMERKLRRLERSYEEAERDTEVRQREAEAWINLFTSTEIKDPMLKTVINWYFIDQRNIPRNILRNNLQQAWGKHYDEQQLKYVQNPEAAWEWIQKLYSERKIETPNLTNGQSFADIASKQKKALPIEELIEQSIEGEKGWVESFKSLALHPKEVKAVLYQYFEPAKKEGRQKKSKLERNLRNAFNDTSIEPKDRVQHAWNWLKAQTSSTPTEGARLAKAQKQGFIKRNLKEIKVYFIKKSKAYFTDERLDRIYTRLLFYARAYIRARNFVIRELVPSFLKPNYLFKLYASSNKFSSAEVAEGSVQEWLSAYKEELTMYSEDKGWGAPEFKVTDSGWKGKKGKGPRIYEVEVELRDKNGERIADFTRIIELHKVRRGVKALIRLMGITVVFTDEGIASDVYEIESDLFTRYLPKTVVVSELSSRKTKHLFVKNYNGPSLNRRYLKLPWSVWGLGKHYFNRDVPEIFLGVTAESQFTPLLHAYGRLHLWLLQPEIYVEGIEKISKKHSSLVAATHISMRGLDGILAISSLAMRYNRKLRPIVLADHLNWFGRLLAHEISGILVKKGQTKYEVEKALNSHPGSLVLFFPASAPTRLPKDGKVSKQANSNLRWYTESLFLRQRGIREGDSPVADWAIDFNKRLKKHEGSDEKILLQPVVIQGYLDHKHSIADLLRIALLYRLKKFLMPWRKIPHPFTLIIRFGDPIDPTQFSDKDVLLKELIKQTKKINSSDWDEKVLSRHPKPKRERMSVPEEDADGPEESEGSRLSQSDSKVISTILGDLSNWIESGNDQIQFDTKYGPVLLRIKIDHGFETHYFGHNRIRLVVWPDEEWKVQNGNNFHLDRLDSAGMVDQLLKLSPPIGSLGQMILDKDSMGTSEDLESSGNLLDALVIDEIQSRRGFNSIPDGPRKALDLWQDALIQHLIAYAKQRSNLPVIAETKEDYSRLNIVQRLRNYQYPFGPNRLNWEKKRFWFGSSDGPRTVWVPKSQFLDGSRLAAPQNLIRINWEKPRRSKSDESSLALSTNEDLYAILPDWPYRFNVQVTENNDERIRIEISDVYYNNIIIELTNDTFPKTILLGHASPVYGGGEGDQEIYKKAIGTVMRSWILRQLEEWIASRGYDQLKVRLLGENIDGKSSQERYKKSRRYFESLGFKILPDDHKIMTKFISGPAGWYDEVPESLREALIQLEQDYHLVRTLTTSPESRLRVGSLSFAKEYLKVATDFWIFKSLSNRNLISRDSVQNVLDLGAGYWNYAPIYPLFFENFKEAVGLESDSEKVKGFNEVIVPLYRLNSSQFKLLESDMRDLDRTVSERHDLAVLQNPQTESFNEDDYQKLFSDLSYALSPDGKLVIVVDEFRMGVDGNPALFESLGYNHVYPRVLLSFRMPNVKDRELFAVPVRAYVVTQKDLEKFRNGEKKGARLSDSKELQYIGTVGTYTENFKVNVIQPFLRRINDSHQKGFALHVKFERTEGRDEDDYTDYSKKRRQMEAKYPFTSGLEIKLIDTDGDSPHRLLEHTDEKGKTEYLVSLEDNGVIYMSRRLFLDAPIEILAVNVIKPYLDARSGGINLQKYEDSIQGHSVRKIYRSLVDNLIYDTTWFDLAVWFGFLKYIGLDFVVQKFKKIDAKIDSGMDILSFAASKQDLPESKTKAYVDLGVKFMKLEGPIYIYKFAMAALAGSLLLVPGAQWMSAVLAVLMFSTGPFIRYILTLDTMVRYRILPLAVLATTWIPTVGAFLSIPTQLIATKDFWHLFKDISYLRDMRQIALRLYEVIGNSDFKREVKERLIDERYKIADLIHELQSRSGSKIKIIYAHYGHDKLMSILENSDVGIVLIIDEMDHIHSLYDSFENKLMQDENLSDEERKSYLSKILYFNVKNFMDSDAKEVIFEPLFDFFNLEDNDENVKGSRLSKSKLINEANALLGIPETRIRAFETELGIKSDILAKIVSRHPSFIRHEPLHVRQKLIQELRIEKTDDMASILNSYPQLADLDIGRVKHEFSTELGFNEETTISSIIQFPPIAGYSVKDNLKPKKKMLADIGINSTRTFQALIKVARVNVEIMRLIIEVSKEINQPVQSAEKIASADSTLYTQIKRIHGVSPVKLVKANPLAIQEIIKPELKKILARLPDYPLEMAEPSRETITDRKKETAEFLAVLFSDAPPVVQDVSQIDSFKQYQIEAGQTVYLVGLSIYPDLGKVLDANSRNIAVLATSGKKRWAFGINYDDDQFNAVFQRVQILALRSHASEIVRRTTPMEFLSILDNLLDYFIINYVFHHDKNHILRFRERLDYLKILAIDRQYADALRVVRSIQQNNFEADPFLGREELQIFRENLSLLERRLDLEVKRGARLSSIRFLEKYEKEARTRLQELGSEGFSFSELNVYLQAVYFALKNVSLEAVFQMMVKIVKEIKKLNAEAKSKNNRLWPVEKLTDLEAYTQRTVYFLFIMLIQNQLTTIRENTAHLQDEVLSEAIDELQRNIEVIGKYDYPPADDKEAVKFSQRLNHLHALITSMVKQINLPRVDLGLKKMLMNGPIRWMMNSTSGINYISLPDKSFYYSIHLPKNADGAEFWIELSSNQEVRIRKEILETRLYPSDRQSYDISILNPGQADQQVIWTEISYFVDEFSKDILKAVYDDDLKSYAKYEPLLLELADLFQKEKQKMLGDLHPHAEEMYQIFGDLEIHFRWLHRRVLDSYQTLRKSVSFEEHTYPANVAKGTPSIYVVPLLLSDQEKEDLDVATSFNSSDGVYYLIGNADGPPLLGKGTVISATRTKPQYNLIEFIVPTSELSSFDRQHKEYIRGVSRALKNLQQFGKPRLRVRHLEDTRIKEVDLKPYWEDGKEKQEVVIHFQNLNGARLSQELSGRLEELIHNLRESDFKTQLTTQVAELNSLSSDDAYRALLEIGIKIHQEIQKFSSGSDKRILEKIKVQIVQFLLLQYKKFVQTALEDLRDFYNKERSFERADIKPHLLSLLENLERMDFSDSLYPDWSLGLAAEVQSNLDAVLTQIRGIRQMIVDTDPVLLHPLAKLVMVGNIAKNEIFNDEKAPIRRITLATQKLNQLIFSKNIGENTQEMERLGNFLDRSRNYLEEMGIHESVIEVLLGQIIQSKEDVVKLYESLKAIGPRYPNTQEPVYRSESERASRELEAASFLDKQILQLGSAIPAIPMYLQTLTDFVDDARLLKRLTQTIWGNHKEFVDERIQSSEIPESKREALSSWEDFKIHFERAPTLYEATIKDVIKKIDPRNLGPEDKEGSRLASVALPDEFLKSLDHFERTLLLIQDRQTRLHRAFNKLWPNEEAGAVSIEELRQRIADIQNGTLNPQNIQEIKEWVHHNHDEWKKFQANFNSLKEPRLKALTRKVSAQIGFTNKRLVQRTLDRLPDYVDVIRLAEDIKKSEELFNKKYLILERELSFFELYQELGFPEGRSLLMNEMRRLIPKWRADLKSFTEAKEIKKEFYKIIRSHIEQYIRFKNWGVRPSKPSFESAISYATDILYPELAGELFIAARYEEDYDLFRKSFVRFIGAPDQSYLPADRWENLSQLERDLLFLRAHRGDHESAEALYQKELQLILDYKFTEFFSDIADDSMDLMILLDLIRKTSSLEGRIQVIAAYFRVFWRLKSEGKIESGLEAKWIDELSRVIEENRSSSISKSSQFFLQEYLAETRQYIRFRSYQFGKPFYFIDRLSKPQNETFSYLHALKWARTDRRWFLMHSEDESERVMTTEPDSSPKSATVNIFRQEANKAIVREIYNQRHAPSIKKFPIPSERQKKLQELRQLLTEETNSQLTFLKTTRYRRPETDFVLGKTAPDVILALGTPGAEKYVKLAEYWHELKEKFGVEVPIIASTGRGRGTEYLIQDAVQYYAGDPQKSHEFEAMRDFLGRRITEAHVIRFILGHQNVPVKMVRLERMSTNTLENIQFSRYKIENMFGKNKAIKILIFTTSQHTLRADLTALKQYQGTGWEIRTESLFDPELDKMSDQVFSDFMTDAIGLPSTILSSSTVNRESEIERVHAYGTARIAEGKEPYLVPFDFKDEPWNAERARDLREGLFREYLEVFNASSGSRLAGRLRSGPEVVNAAIVSHQLSPNEESLMQEAEKNMNLNFVRLDPARNPISVLNVEGKTLFAAKEGYIYRNGKEIFIDFIKDYGKPLLIHYLIPNAKPEGRFYGTMIASGIPIPDSQTTRSFLDDKDISIHLLSSFPEIHVPKSELIKITNHSSFVLEALRREPSSNLKLTPFSREEGSFVPRVRQILLDFLESNNLAEAVAKPNDGKQGENVIYFNKSSLEEAVTQVVTLLRKSTNVLLQEKINPPLIQSKGQSMDWNLRGFVSRDQNGEWVLSDQVVRYSTNGTVVNISRGAKGMRYEDLAKLLDLSEDESQALLKKLRDLSKAVVDKMEASLRNYKLLKESEHLSDFIGLDIMLRLEKGELVPYLIEINGANSGGMWEKDRYVRSKIEEGNLSPEELGRPVRDWVRLIQKRGLAYKHNLPWEYELYVSDESGSRLASTHPAAEALFENLVDEISKIKAIPNSSPRYTIQYSGRYKRNAQISSIVPRKSPSPPDYIEMNLVDDGRIRIGSYSATSVSTRKNSINFYIKDDDFYFTIIDSADKDTYHTPIPVTGIGIDPTGDIYIVLPRRALSDLDHGFRDLEFMKVLVTSPVAGFIAEDDYRAIQAKNLKLLYLNTPERLEKQFLVPASILTWAGSLYGGESTAQENYKYFHKDKKYNPEVSALLALAVALRYDHSRGLAESDFREFVSRGIPDQPAAWLAASMTNRKTTVGISETTFKDFKKKHYGQLGSAVLTLASVISGQSGYPETLFQTYNKKRSYVPAALMALLAIKASERSAEQRVNLFNKHVSNDLAVILSALASFDGSQSVDNVIASNKNSMTFIQNLRGARLALDINDLLGEKPYTQTLMNNLYNPGNLSLVDYYMKLLPISRSIQDVKNILVIGGVESEIRDFLHLAPDSVITNVDVNLERLEVLKASFEKDTQFISRLKLYRADASDLPNEIFENASFDFIYAGGLDESAFKSSGEEKRVLSRMALEEERLLSEKGVIFHFMENSGVYFKDALESGRLIKVPGSYGFFYKKDGARLAGKEKAIAYSVERRAYRRSIRYPLNANPIVIGVSNLRVREEVQKIIGERKDVRIQIVPSFRNRENRIRFFERSAGNFRWTVFLDQEELNYAAKKEFLKQLSQADFNTYPALFDLLNKKVSYSNLSKEEQEKISGLIFKLLPSISKRTIEDLNSEVSNPERALELLKLYLYHPSFGYEFSEDFNSIASDVPRAAIWTEEDLKEPGFFEALNDRDRKLGDKLTIHDFVQIGPATDVQKLLGDRYGLFVSRFTEDRILKTADQSAESLFGRLNGVYKKENVLFIDRDGKNRRHFAVEAGSELKVLVLKGEYALTLDKVVAEILARSGRLENLFIKGLDIQGNILYFAPVAPIDFVRQFKKTYEALQAVGSAA